jgi:hypothetical protein
VVEVKKAGEAAFQEAKADVRRNPRHNAPKPAFSLHIVRENR